jgi:cellulose synthase/poly-beta-1,6-N-acetylglucosamine synthase-like glycosyltransferase
MTSLLPLGLVGILLIGATLPLLTELFVLTTASWFAAKRENQSSINDVFPLTVVIPAHNEEALIGRTVRSVIESGGTGTDVLVVAHNSTDSTAGEARASGAQVLELNDLSRNGKGYALQAGFERALAGGAQAVLVIDADSLVCSRLIPDVRSRMHNGAQALQCRYEVQNTDANWRTNLVALAFHAFNVIRPRGRERLGLSAGIFGNGFALHREVLCKIPYDAFSIVEDLQYHIELVRAGYRVEFVDSAVVRGEMPVSVQGARSQRARWEGGRLRMMMQWTPCLLADIGRGRARLAEPLLDLLSLSIASQVCLLIAMMFLPFAWARWYAGCALVVLFLHVTTAALDGPGLLKTVKALVAAPGHILWKVSLFPNIWRAAKPKAAWVRTSREAPAKTKKSGRRLGTDPVL